MTDTTLEIALVDGSGKAIELEQIAVEVILFTGGRERYRFDAGDTDDRGVSTTSFRALEEKRKENQALFVMDYNTPLVECDPIAGGSVVRPEEFQRRLEAVLKWFPDKAAALERRMIGSSNAMVRADDQKFSILFGAENRLSVVCTRISPQRP